MELVVLDASAVLAWLRGETGGEKLRPYLSQCLMSLVNYAEVRQRFWRDNINPAPYFEIFEATPVQLLSPDRDQARDAGDLERLTKPIGASLADRFCLGLALSRNLPVVTTDKPWDRLGLPLDIRQLR